MFCLIKAFFKIKTHYSKAENFASLSWQIVYIRYPFWRNSKTICVFARDQTKIFYLLSRHVNYYTMEPPWKKNTYTHKFVQREMSGLLVILNRLRIYLKYIKYLFPIQWKQ